MKITPTHGYDGDVALFFQRQDTTTGVELVSSAEVARESEVDVAAGLVQPGDHDLLVVALVFLHDRVERGYGGGVPDVRCGHVDHHMLRVIGVLEPRG